MEAPERTTVQVTNENSVNTRGSNFDDTINVFEGSSAGTNEENSASANEEFNAFLAKLGIQVGLPDADSVAKGPVSLQAKSPDESSVTGLWSPGCEIAGYVNAVYKYDIKTFHDGSLEAELLMKAFAKHEYDDSDVGLPVLFSHCHHAPSSTRLLVMLRPKYGTLRKFCEFFGARPLDKIFVAKIVAGVTDALHFIHVQDVYHGSISECCIFVDEGAVGRLGGLSTAKIIKKGMSFENSYPEQFRAPDNPQSRLSPQAQDMFAFGVIIYKMITGYYPVRDSTKNGMVLTKTANPVWPISADEEMWETVERLLYSTVCLRPCAGTLLHTNWIKRAKEEPVRQMLLCLRD